MSIILSRDRRIDWPRIIANLQKTGMSLQQIADAVEVGKRTIMDYAREDLPAEPAHWTGHCLVILWCDQCGTSMQDVPTRAVPPTVSQMLKDMA